MNDNMTSAYLKQLEYKAQGIINMGFDYYFLIVQDLMNWACAANFYGRTSCDIMKI